MHRTESILIKLLKAGNTEVFESIYNKFYGQLYLYSREYVIREEVAKELVQDTFLRLWQVKESLQDDTSLKSYLYRITRNNCLNYIKHLKVEERYRNFSTSEKLELKLNLIALSQSGLDKLISDELEDRIYQTVKSLPPRCRQIFEMSRNEDKKYKEIAEELNVSVKTVENQILKALKILRDKLADFKNYLLVF